MTITINGTTGIAGVDGSASTPAVQGADTNTGVFFPAADTIAFAEGGAEAMRIDSSGNVGIGTSSPATLLHVAKTSGTVQVRVSSDTDVSFRALATSADSSAFLQLSNDARDWTLRVNGAESDQFQIRDSTAGATRMVIDSSGNLLVGTTTAEGRATIRGSTSDSTAFTFSTEAQDGTDQLRVRCDGAVYMGLDGSSPYNLTNGAAANAVLLSDGFLYRSTSSLRYKRDIRDLTHGLAKVLELRSVTYKGISPSDGENVYGGFIAEEVHAAGLTEFVQYDNEGQPDALHYGNMVALMAKAIQELKAELDTVKAQNAAFEARLAALEAK
jgi:hypothetical protein